MKASSQSNQPNPTQANPTQLLAIFSLVLSRANKDGDNDGDCIDDGAGDYDGVVDKEQRKGALLLEMCVSFPSHCYARFCPPI